MILKTILFFVLSACVNAAAVLDKKSISDPLADLHTIEVYDDISLNLNADISHSSIIKDAGVDLAIKDGVMSINAKKSNKENNIDLSGHVFKNLKNIFIFDKAVVNAKGLNSLYVLVNSSSASSHINGYLPIKKIKQNKGHLKVDGINSKKLRVYALGGKLDLQGSVKKLIFESKSNSETDAKLLVCDDVWVLSEGSSFAVLNPTEQLHAVTKNHAQVIVNKVKYYSTLTGGGEIIFN